MSEAYALGNLSACESFGVSKEAWLRPTLALTGAGLGALAAPTDEKVEGMGFGGAAGLLAGAGIAGVGNGIGNLLRGGPKLSPDDLAHLQQRVPEGWQRHEIPKGYEVPPDLQQFGHTLSGGKSRGNFSFWGAPGTTSTPDPTGALKMRINPQSYLQLDPTGKPIPDSYQMGPMDPVIKPPVRGAQMPGPKPVIHGTPLPGKMEQLRTAIRPLSTAVKQRFQSPITATPEGITMQAGRMPIMDRMRQAGQGLSSFARNLRGKFGEEKLATPLNFGVSARNYPVGVSIQQPDERLWGMDRWVPRSTLERAFQAVDGGIDPEQVLDDERDRGQLAYPALGALAGGGLAHLLGPETGKAGLIAKALGGLAGAGAGAMYHDATGDQRVDQMQAALKGAKTERQMSKFPIQGQGQQTAAENTPVIISPGGGMP